MFHLHRFFTVTSTKRKGLGLRLRNVHNLPVVKIVLHLVIAFLSVLFYADRGLVFG